MAFPSVLNPAIIGPDTTVKATNDQASWIAVSIGIGGFVSYAYLPAIFDVYGRKVTNLTTNVVMIIGSLTLYVAYDIYTLAFARFVQGLAYGSNSSMMTICECVPPKRRGYFMVIIKVSFGIGSLFCHALGLVLNWRQIAVFNVLVNLLSIILLIIASESPSFFASKAQFEKCEAAFKWYRGDSLNARKELKELVAAQKENFNLKQRERNMNIFKKTKNMLLTKEFRKSCCIVTLAFLCIDSCGRVFILAYITQILIEITNNKSSAMYMSVVSDALIITALCISSVLVKFFSRRTLLIRLGLFSAFLMFTVSVTIILRNNITILQDIKWLVPSILLFQVFITNMGIVPLAFVLTGEVFSLDQRALGTIVSGLAYFIFFNIVLKITPALIDNTGVEGTYSIYGTCLVIFLLLLINVLPETKDRTLQAIEDEIKGIVRRKSEVELLEINSN